MSNQFLTAVEVAAIFRCHPETVMRKARAGQLRAFKFGRRWFFRHEEIADYVSLELKLSSSAPR